jgi:hypothetical protein
VSLGHQARDSSEALSEALSLLDGVLRSALAAAATGDHATTLTDPYRGLYVSRADVERMLAGEPDQTPLASTRAIDAFLQGLKDLSVFARLQSRNHLTDLEIGLIVVALAPEVALRYERLYAYLQDDVTRKRPTVDLALRLLCPSPDAQIEAVRLFAPEAGLIRRGILHLVAEPGQPLPPLLSHYLKPDDVVVDFLRGQLAGFEDSRAGPAVINKAPSYAGENDNLIGALSAALSRALARASPLVVQLQGTGKLTKQRTAEAAARANGRGLLVIDSPALDSTISARSHLLRASLEDAVLYIDLTLYDAGDAASCLLAVAEASRSSGDCAIVATPELAARPLPIETYALVFPSPGPRERRSSWAAHLEAQDLSLAPNDLDALAERYNLNEDQIADSVRAAGRALAPPAASTDAAERTRAVFAAARAHSGGALDELTYRMQPVYTWDDIVLPPEVTGQLRELCDRVVHRHRVFQDWGFARKLSLGKGITALFAGPSGAGKTMAAEVIANELQLELYRIDLSGVVSKYIGETEKNLDQLFRAAATASAILFFDEADALFGKRSEVRDSHDRYANVEVSYLLQKIEEHEGLTILATNLRQNLDEAFLRRLTLTVHFPFPDEPSRARIWAGVWPVETPLAPGIDFEVLAREHRLSGGNIKNIALTAAFFAARDGCPVGMEQIASAIRREYQKLGKTMAEGAPL